MIGRRSEDGPAAGLGQCPQCKGPGAGPFLHRGIAFAACDGCQIRWRTGLSQRDVAVLDLTRLQKYATGDGVKLRTRKAVS